MAAADWNADGKTDLAVVDGSRALSIRLSTPDGTLGSRRDYATESTPETAAVADFDRNGALDIALATAGDGRISLLFGNGDGTFQPRLTFVTAVNSREVITADLNRDGIPDLVTATDFSTVAVLLGKGDGSFEAYKEISTPGAGGSRFGSVAAGDFDRDGRADLVVPNTNGNTVSVLRGNGDGTFQPLVMYATGFGPVAVTAGDFNGDGSADLAAVNAGFSNGVQSDSVSILLANGDGTFRPNADRAVGSSPRAVRTADLDRDGRLDLITTHDNCSSSPCAFGSFSVLLGNGDGTFKPRADYGTGIVPSTALGDFNGDGSQDVAIAYANCRFFPCGGSFSILLGNGAGAFTGSVPYATARYPSSLTAADFDLDGDSDLVVLNQFANTISMLRNSGGGAFQAHAVIITGLASVFVIAADPNKDGKPDLITANGTNTVSILIGNGDGTFQSHVDYATGSGPDAVNVADFNGDGKVDLAVVNAGQGFGDSVSVLQGNGDGTFKPRAIFPAGMSATSLTSGDFNADGRPDLAVVNNIPSGISILLNRGDGTFREPVTYLPAPFSQSVAAADFDEDGKLDLAVTSFGNSPGPVSVLLGNGDGTFRNRVDYPTGYGARRVIAGDFSGDGHLDLAIASTLHGSVSILRGDGDGTFRRYTDFAAGKQALSLIAADFDGDSGLDVAITAEDNTVSVLLNPPFIALSAAELRFATRPATLTDVRTVIVTNPSATPFSISDVRLSGDFIQTNTCPTMLAPGDDCTIDLRFFPPTVGIYEGVLTITDGARGSPHRIQLSGLSAIRRRAVNR